MVARLARWLRSIIFIASFYGLLFVFDKELTAISPTLPGGSDQKVAIFGASANAGTMLLWGVCFYMIQPCESRAMRIRYALMAGFLVAFALVVLQTRTVYLQLMSLVGLMLFVRPRPHAPLLPPRPRPPFLFFSLLAS